MATATAKKKKNQEKGMDFEEKDFGSCPADMGMADFIRKFYLGQPVHFIMARYGYAGIVVYVGSDFVILAQAHAIEDGESGEAPKPRLATPCGSSIILVIDAIETICQPAWAFGNKWSSMQPS